MSLISVAFVAFFAITLLLYYLLPRKWQWCLLLAAGIAFYLYSGPKHIIWIAITTAVTYAAGILTQKSADKFAAAAPELKKTLSKEDYKAAAAKAEKRRKIWLWLALFVDFGILCLLKYLDFIVGNFALLFKKDFEGFNLIVPLGLSYFTFAAVGYIIDVSRGKYPAERNFARFALYMTFFPQMIQGPIPRFEKLSAQLTSPHSFDYERFLNGLRLMLWGVFKVLVISAPFGTVVNQLTGTYKIAGGSSLWYWQSMTGTEIWLSMFAWGIQLYTNFSGGIDIVTGASQCFGIELEENFRRPYFATDLTDYWNRWHISLSNWLKDYMFYPIALSKRYARFAKFLKKKFGKFIARTVPVGLCSLLLFTVVGIWHGANWGEILFGVFNGVIILASTLLEPVFEKIRPVLHMEKSVFWRIFRSVRTFIVITLCRVISRAPDVSTGFKWYGRMFSSFGFSLFLSDTGTKLPVLVNSDTLINMIPALIGCIILFIAGYIEERNGKDGICVILSRKNTCLRIAIEVLILAIIVIFGTYGIGYNAAEFIYKHY